MLILLNFALAGAPENPVGFSGTTLLPDARHRADGEAEIGTGMIGFIAWNTALCDCDETMDPDLTDEWVSPAIGIRAAWTPGLDVRAETNLGWDPDLGMAGTATLAWSIAIDEYVRVGVFGGGMIGTRWGLQGLGGGGLSLSARWRRSAIDITVPVVQRGTLLDPVRYPAPLATEATWSLDLGRGHAVRVGMFGYLPGCGWQWAGDRWLVRIEVHGLGDTANGLAAGRVEVGMRL